MRMMRRNPDERVTQDLGIEICKRRGLKALVVPEIAAIGSTYVITLDAIDAHSQRLIARQQVEANNKDQVVAALGKAGSQLRKRLGEGLSSLQEFNAPLDLATTSSLEALQAYSSGLALYRSGKRREAIPFFERAVELDPQFCSAYDQLGRAQHSIESQEAGASFARAFELKDRRLTQEENFQTTALYYAEVTGNLEKEATVVVLYRQIYPRSVDAANLLGINYAMMGKTEEALQEFQWAIAHSPVPSSQYNSNAGQALIILGRFDDAKKLLDQWRQRGSLTPFQLILRYRIAVIEHDTATMERLAREIPHEDAPWVHLQMHLAFLRGDVATLRSLSDALVSRQRKANHMGEVAGELADHADAEAYLGNYDLAHKLCAQADEAGNNSGLGLFKCSHALGQAADTSAAEALAAKLNELSPENTFDQKVLLPVTHSTIQRTRGNLRAAVDLLSPVTQFPNVLVFYNRARAYMAAGDQAKAIADFQTVIENPGWPEWEPFEPLSQLGLAQAYAKQGDSEKSRKAYDDFFATWKDADPGIPILRQAKAEYRKLTTPAPAAVSPSGAQR
jgi:tetratricopeptide (TPR) repeat protein